MKTDSPQAAKAGRWTRQSARSSLGPRRLETLMSRIVAHVEERYGVAVRSLDVPAPFLGDLDGAEIRLQQNQDPEATLFTLVHLFGHTVQWNLSEHARNLGNRPAGQYTEADLVEIEAYEREASRYGLEILHQAGAHDLDGWLSDYAACDLAYLRHFYTTGEHRPPKEFWHPGQPHLEPLAIPPFTPCRFRARWESVVV